MAKKIVYAFPSEKGSKSSSRGERRYQEKIRKEKILNRRKKSSKDEDQ